MRNKKIMIAAMLAVMVAMTGIAAANPFTIHVGLADSSNPNDDVSVNPIPIPTTAGTTTYSLHYGNILFDNFGQPYSITCTVTGPNAAITASCLSPFTPSSYIHIGVNAMTITNDGTATPNGRYLITFTGDVMPSSTVQVLPDPALGSVYVTPIPEFPTVALPVAAVIGLVFFFQQRKKKEE